MSSEERTTRPTIDEYFMQLALTASTRSTCRHRWQGAVIVRSRRVISTGYNGAPPGVTDCLELGYCSKGRGLPCLAEGLHGELNAILSAAMLGTSVAGAIVYCVYSPCRHCCNAIKSAGICGVKYLERYEGFIGGPEYLSSIGILSEKINMLVPDYFLPT